MTPQTGPRPGRGPLRAVLVVLALTTIAAPVGALTAASAHAGNAPLAVSFSARTLRLGQPLVARGRLASADAGRQAFLQVAPAGHGWRTLARTRVGARGAYRLSAVPRTSGTARVLVPARSAAASANTSNPGGPGAPGAAPLRTSRPRALAVAARVAVRARRLQVLSGHAVRVAGVLLPGRSGRVVRLEGRRHGRWTTLGRARSTAHGRFSVRVVAHGLGSLPLRVRFAGDRANAGSRVRAGSLEAFRVSSASWYQLTGYRLGCGGRMGVNQLGVAHKTLPCGTMVTFRYGGRSVRVPVIDRGPYVGGREWDLSRATKQALGFPGLGRIWSSR